MCSYFPDFIFKKLPKTTRRQPYTKFIIVSNTSSTLIHSTNAKIKRPDRVAALSAELPYHKHDKILSE